MEENYKQLMEIIGKSYLIGSYQRGYRWDESNVEKLLKDIFEGRLVEDFEFENTNYIDANKIIQYLHNENERDNVEYCLQPLVLKKIGDKYSVIDGQQRLTTLYIILKALCSVSTITFPVSFVIEYQSREKSKEFLQTLSEESEENDIDSAYMIQAFRFSKKWFIERNKAFQNLLNSNFVKCDENKLVDAFASYLLEILLEKTKFIWDEIDESSADMNKKEQKIFADRNTGRLALTNSELIKSLFMNPDYYGKNVVGLKDRQTLISEIWDIYENELHNEEFWKFIPVSEEVREQYRFLTRIDVIFLLLIQKKGYTKNLLKENELFEAVEEWINKETQNTKKEEEKTDGMIACWREVCDVYDGIKELFDKNEIYNLLSLYKMIDNNSSDVFEKYNEVLDESKNLRAEIVKRAICTKLFASGIEKSIKSVRFPDRDNIRKMLVAYNVAITNTSNPINRFGFHFFDKIKGVWDIEHIYATNEGYIASASLEKKIELLKIFGESNHNIYKEYIETLYSINIEEEQGEMDENKYMDECFEKAGRKYTKEFDIWRYLKLKNYCKELLEKYNIMVQISNLLESANFDNDVEAFIQSGDYDDTEVFMFLRREYLNWDKKLDDEYEKIKRSGEKKDSINWHGYSVKIQDIDTFWSDSVEKERLELNFIHRYYRDFLNMIYDNTGIPADYVTFKNHGEKRTKIIKEDNREKFRAFFKGIVYRIEESIHSFFRKDESISSLDKDLGQQSDYQIWAAFVNDNSMGNMMLLPMDINRAGNYSDKNFSGKRKYMVDKGHVFLPIATSNVLMGKFIDLETSTEQWLMKERKTYLNDMITVMQAYYGREGTKA